MYEGNVREIEELMKKNEDWRNSCINLIASENITSKRVRQVMASDFMHRYAEGHPGERYYRGTRYIDNIETDLRKNIETLFGCRHSDIRPISGTNANEAVFSVYIKPGDVVMVNSTSGGGHISHHKIGGVGKFTKNIIDLPLTADGYHTDINKTKYLIQSIKPKLLILGKSLFLFPEPVKELREMCDKYKITIIYDAAHVLGLIAGKQFQDPFKEGADIVTASTHKTFFGTQRGIILSNISDKEWSKIDKGAFPGSSSNHHLDTLVGLAIATCEMMEFGEEYSIQTIKNAKILAQSLDRKGFDAQAKEFGYTESHQVAVDVSKYNGGKKVSEILERNGIILNMNLLPSEPNGDPNNPKGIRLGTLEMTRVGMKEPEMEKIAELMKECVIDGKNIREEVKKFRANFQDVHYSFDNLEDILKS